MKRYGKRIVSAILVAALVVTLMPSGWGEGRYYADEMPGAFTASGTVVRGVVDKLTELPQYRANGPDFTLVRGTAERPFVILEIVPYEEYGELGYLIGGCEPVNIERLQTDSQQKISDIANMGVADIVTSSTKAYFFADEPEYQRYFEYKTSVMSVGDKVQGYYERVPEGTGNFRLVVGTAISMPVEDAGDVVVGGNEELGGEDGQGDGAENTGDEPIPDEDVFDGNDELGGEDGEAEDADGVDEVSVKRRTSRIVLTGIEEPMSGEEIVDSAPEDGGNGDATDGTGGGAPEEGGDTDQNEPPVTEEKPEEEIPGEEEPAVPGDSLPEEMEPVPDVDTGDLEDQSDEGEEPVSPLAEAVTFVPVPGGDLIWHSCTDAEAAELGITFPDPSALDPDSLSGDRIYTVRTVEADDNAIQLNTFFAYQNKELFLTRSLGLDAERAAAYSVVVKTITPGQLNQTPDWIDYADLVYLSPKNHVTNVPELWENYRRLTDHQPRSSYNTKRFEEDDLSWETTLRLYRKCTAVVNFAGIILDDTIFNSGAYAPSDRRNVSINIHDWNLRPFSPERRYEGKYASRNNIHKLAIMLLAMDSNLFTKLYLTGTEPAGTPGGDEPGAYIQGGKITLQTGEAAEYWTIETFQLLDPNASPSLNPYDYWGSSEVWENYHSTRESEITTKKDWVNEHVFTFDGSNSIAQMFDSTNLKTDSKFSEFHDFYGEYVYDENDANHQRPHPADAVRYILGVDDRSEPEPVQSIRVLDLEPSVGLNNDATFSPNWYLRESYIRMLVPSFRGDVEIVHQTTAEFIGKTEDLNSEYQMIFMGLDYGAYNTRSQNLQLSTGWVTKDWPDWNDNSMDGRIYTHTGDVMESAEFDNGSRTRSVKWLLINGNTLDSTQMRFPGNDISRLKMADLNDYIKAGYPVVAESYLYDLQTALIDPTSYIYQFIDEAKKAGATVYSTSQVAAIEEVVEKVSVSPVTFDVLPAAYNGEERVDGSGKVVFDNPNYLPINSGRSYMEFGFYLTQEGYRWRVYVDQDRNSKFSEDECVYGPVNASAGYNYYNYRIAWSSYMIGLVQWKIEVYREANPAERYVRQGCSAVQNTTGERKVVNVLQIMPHDNGDYNGKLNLETSSLFRTYYENLVDYEVHIKTITADEYESYFYHEETTGWGWNQTTRRVSNGFSYKYVVSQEEGIATGADQIVAKTPQGATEQISRGYNMIIFGFGDTYGGHELDNTYGAVDYLKYYADQGRSILFCHDLTSFYSLPYNGVNLFGHTANATLRDMMGMNRYRALSNQLSGEERDSMIAYQNRNSDNYDWMWSNAVHGFTYYAMKRMGWSNSESNGNIWNNYRMPYRYTITNPAGNAISSTKKEGQTSGFNNGNDITTVASMVNEGQITEYPYKIGETLPIAATHGQWFQMSPEDEDVTVWYCLAGDSSNIAKTDNGNDGTSLTYQVSPNDAMNNYYIYSKGNIFYSGVGHSEVTGTAEAKLFVNTMIAAYNASCEPPLIEILNDEAVPTGAQEYEIELMQEFNDFAGGIYGLSDGDGFTSDYPVEFAPIDFNTIATAHMEFTIMYVDENGREVYVDKVTRISDGKVISADLNPNSVKYHKFYGDDIINGEEYIFYFPYRYLSLGNNDSPWRTVEFEIKSDRVNATNSTEVHMVVQPLFPLD